MDARKLAEAIRDYADANETRSGTAAIFAQAEEIAEHVVAKLEREEG